MKDFYGYMDKDANDNNELFRQLLFILNATDICAKQEIVDAEKKSRIDKNT